jgi:hypothetical protein
VAAVEAEGLVKVYGGRQRSYPSDSWPAQPAPPPSIVCTAGLVVVFAPLAVLRYRAIGR